MAVIDRLNVNQTPAFLKDGVFDISEYNNGAVYTDLSDALGQNGINIPPTIRKGGMSVKFIMNDNKYVQYRLMVTSFSTTESDWQGVDDEPITGSDNLVKSGGVERINIINHVQQYTKEQKRTARANIGLSNVSETENTDSDDIKVVDDENNRDLMHIHRTDSSIGNSFVITDDNDNEICKADKNGFHAQNLFYGSNDTNIEDTITNLE